MVPSLCLHTKTFFTFQQFQDVGGDSPELDEDEGEEEEEAEDAGEQEEELGAPGNHTISVILYWMYIV